MYITAAVLDYVMQDPRISLSTKYIHLFLPNKTQMFNLDFGDIMFFYLISFVNPDGPNPPTFTKINVFVAFISILIV